MIIDGHGHACGKYLTAESIKSELDHFGADKLIFGSDTPYGNDNIKKGLNRVDSMDIPVDEKNRIKGLNLKELI